MFPDVRRADGNHIGMQNVSSARRKLEEMGVPITAEDTGGTFGRTICLDVATGRLRVRSIASGEKEI
jgi:chemotaxis protein CheD